MENRQSVSHLLPVILTESHNEVSFWRLPPEIGQSRLGGRKTPSHACVFIVIRMAELIHRRAISFGVHTGRTCHPTLIHVLCNGILEGNEDHSKFSQDEKTTYVVPDCLELTGVFKEIDFVCVEDALDSLPIYLHKIIKSYHLMHLKKVNIILISAERAVLLVYERDHDAFLFIDSHSHGRYGAVTAYVKRAHLNDFADFLKTRVFPNFESKFELSVINFSGMGKPDDCSQMTPPLGSCSIFAKKRRLAEEGAFNSKQTKNVAYQPYMNVLLRFALTDIGTFVLRLLSQSASLLLWEIIRCCCSTSNALLVYLSSVGQSCSPSKNLIRTPVSARVECFYVVGQLKCPTAPERTARVRIDLMDEDPLPLEQDDTLGRTWSSKNGTFAGKPFNHPKYVSVTGCGSDFGPINTPDGYVRIFHSCPHRFGKSDSGKLELDILPLFLPKIVDLGSIYLDRTIDDEE